MGDPVDSSTAPWLEPVRGGHLNPALLALPGIEQLRAALAGYQPRSPISHLTGMQLIEAGLGTAVFEMPLSDWLCALQGAISIGPLAIVADSALGAAVESGLPAATPFVTSELSIRKLGPVQPGASVVARGSLLTARRAIALSEVSLTDAHGGLLAHGSSLCFVLPQLSGGSKGAPRTRTELARTILSIRTCLHPRLAPARVGRSPRMR